jgi:hypothetical protein
VVGDTGDGGFVLLADAWRPLRELIAYVKVGKRVRRLKKRTKTLRLPVARLRKGVTVQSVDAFGNVERPKRVKRRIKRTKRRAR